MKALLVSRYPRVDTVPWKRAVAAGLMDAGMDVSVLYSRATLLDQARAGLREDGPRLFNRYLALRGHGAGAGTEQSLAAWAEERGITVVRTRRLGDRAPVRALAPDLIALLGADIVPPQLLAIPRLGTINAHYGLLPAYRGMHVTEWSIYNGDPVGVSVHLVDAGVDTGAVLLREELALDRGETFATLRRKHQDLAARLMVRAALALRDGTAQPVAQRPEEGRQYYRMHPALRQVAEARLQALSERVSTAAPGARSGSPSIAAAASIRPSATWASHQRR